MRIAGGVILFAAVALADKGEDAALAKLRTDVQRRFARLAHARAEGEARLEVATGVVPVDPAAEAGIQGCRRAIALLDAVDRLRADGHAIPVGIDRLRLRVRELIDGPHAIRLLAARIRELHREVLRLRLEGADLRELDELAWAARAKAEEGLAAFGRDDDTRAEAVRAELDAVASRIEVRLRPFGLSEGLVERLQAIEGRSDVVAPTVDTSGVEIERRIEILEDRLFLANREGRGDRLEELRAALRRHYEALRLVADAPRFQDEATRDVERWRIELLLGEIG